MGATLLQRKNRLIQNFSWWNHDFISYTDGAWRIANNSQSVGIGGCILDKEENLLYIFSGPCSADSPRDAEREAILFLFKAFTSQNSIQGRLQINTDCMSLVDEFQKQRAGLSKTTTSEDWLTLLNTPGIYLNYTPREHLVGAHELAIQVRDDEGVILAILTGSLGHLNPRANELWTIQLGFQMAFKLRENAIEKETESAAALQEWEDHRWFTDPRHTRMVEQLNQRVSIGRLHLVKRVIAPRFIGGNFIVVDEDEYEVLQQQQMEVEENGQAGEAGQGIESARSGGGIEVDQAFLDID
ncbi:hypothetical protein ACET3Z_025023 [Daucus carota]